MKEINIKLNSDQLNALLKLVYLGEWILNSHLDCTDEKLTIEEEVEQIIYASITEPGVCEYEKDLKMFFPTRDVEEKMQIFIDEYDNFNFWENLAYQLADRDTKIELGDKFEKMETKNFIDIHHEYVEFYRQEFIKNNLKNVKVK